jgi:hypothetical protein
MVLGVSPLAQALAGIPPVQVDAVSDCARSTDPPTGETRFLSAGVWEIVVAEDPDPNGHFDAWSLWAEGNTVACGSTCWVWEVSIAVPGVYDTPWKWTPTPDPGRWATQPAALAANRGKSTTISLDEPATVYFWIRDNPCTDNRGGMTIHVTEVSTRPEACCLPDNTCVMIDPSSCIDQGGVAQGPGSQCGGIQACCFPDDTCEMLDTLCCINLGGTPKGSGSVCLGDSDGNGVDNACEEGVPAVSEWGMAALALLLLTGFAVKFSRARAKDPVNP